MDNIESLLELLITEVQGLRSDVQALGSGTSLTDLEDRFTELENTLGGPLHYNLQDLHDRLSAIESSVSMIGS